MNTHASKAVSYHIGRPEYPDEFFDYLYCKTGFTSDIILADIGAGTGKVTEQFLKRGNTVFAVEPDPDMMGILKSNLRQYLNCIPVEKAAENTGLPSNIIHCIFCGNSYQWFERNKVIPEFLRMIKLSNLPFQMIFANLGPSECGYTQEILEVDKKFIAPVQNRFLNTAPPFKNGEFEYKIFEYIVRNDFSAFLHGSLSASHAPKKDDPHFNDYCLALRERFDKYSVGGKINMQFRLSCMFGKVENLLYDDCP